MDSVSERALLEGAHLGRYTGAERLAFESLPTRGFQAAHRQVKEADSAASALAFVAAGFGERRTARANEAN
jgi:hypothetical protein